MPIRSKPVRVTFWRAFFGLLGRTIQKAGMVAVLLWVCAAVMSANSQSGRDLTFVWLAAGVPVALFLAILFMAFRVKGALTAERTYIFDEAGIDLVDATARSVRIRWENIAVIQEKPREWIVKLRNRAQFLVPKDGFDDEQVAQAQKAIKESMAKSPGG